MNKTGIDNLLLISSQLLPISVVQISLQIYIYYNSDIIFIKESQQ